MSTELIPPQKLMELIGSTSAEHFVQLGKHFFDLFVKFADLKPTDSVLDVGCGCGRMAVPLTSYLDPENGGSYEGFDIVPELIDWCKTTITPKHPKFHFQTMDLYSSAYNREAKKKASDLKFPYPDNSFDLTFLTSVFTHMLPNDMLQYTREIVRTLKPGGRAFITFFLLNGDSMRLKDTPESKIKLPFPYMEGKVWVNSLTSPEDIVAYPEKTVRRVFHENGLKLREPISYGFWCGRKSDVTFQDVTISTKEG
jgi:SAM-dependent methyltransferase